MPNLMQRGATWLAGKLQTAAGRTVVYRRGNLSGDPITAACSMKQYSIVDAEGFTTTVESVDWLVTTAELVVQGAVITPRPGDRIHEILGGVLVEYEAMKLGSEPCSEWLDTSGVMTVIHTKRIT